MVVSSILSSLRRHAAIPLFIISRAPKRRPYHATVLQLLAVNALEEALEKAATDASHRSHFYRALMQSDIYVIPAPPPENDNNNNPTGGLYLQPWQWQTSTGGVQSILPFFSSVQNVQTFQQSLPESERAPHAKLEGRTFLELVKDYPASIVLNPGLPYGKGFSPTEVSKLLDGSLLPPHEVEPSAILPQDDTSSSEVVMGQPKVYPAEFIHSLQIVFRRHASKLQAAYLAQIFVPDSGEDPHPVIGIEMTPSSNDEQFQSVLKDAIQVQQSILPEELVDFVQVQNDSQDDIVKYMQTKTKPFFVSGGDSSWHSLDSEDEK